MLCEISSREISIEMGNAYQNSSSSSMTESICWRLDMVAAKIVLMENGETGFSTPAPNRNVGHKREKDEDATPEPG